MKAEESNWKSSKVCKIGRSAQLGKFISNVMIFQIQMFNELETWPEISSFSASLAEASFFFSKEFSWN